MIHNNFSILLAERLIKISDVVRDTGISRSTLTNLYYRRSRRIDYEVLDKLCAYLNCGVADILEYRKPPEPDDAGTEE